MWKPLKVLFVGDEPSSKNVSKDVPFVGTPSYKRLLRWIGELDLNIRDVTIINYENDEIRVSDFNKIIFLGTKVASQYNIDVLEYRYGKGLTYITDHPSPRNRKFNDSNYEKKMLKKLKGWLYGQ